MGALIEVERTRVSFQARVRKSRGAEPFSLEFTVPKAAADLLNAHVGDIVSVAIDHVLRLRREAERPPPSLPS